MNEHIFKERTKKLALRVIQLVGGLPKTRAVDVISTQLLRSATSIGTNYRAACRGKSTADVIAKLSIVEGEADESVYWLELLMESHLVPAAHVTELLKEGNEIIAMTVA
jgi:four helix bundle protein